ncbi:MAG: hypothetical protein V4677_13280 [Bacteroidota bacterium]
MTQVKILVNNIHDVTHRAASEAEVNVYLKMGWKIAATHQHINPDNGFLMLTIVLEKEAEDKVDVEVKTEVKEPLKATGDATEKKADPAVKESADVKEKSEEKPTEEKDKPEETDKEQADKEDGEVKESVGKGEQESKKEDGSEEAKKTVDNEIPKGFKIKEKKDTSDEKTESENKEEKE